MEGRREGAGRTSEHVKGPIDKQWITTYDIFEHFIQPRLGFFWWHVIIVNISFLVPGPMRWGAPNIVNHHFFSALLNSEFGQPSLPDPSSDGSRSATFALGGHGFVSRQLWMCEPHYSEFFIILYSLPLCHFVSSLSPYRHTTYFLRCDHSSPSVLDSC